MSFDPWQEPDILARDQYFARPWHQNSPEKRLMSQVLLTAVEDFEQLARTCRSSNDPRMHELTAWFFGHAPDWPFSFLNLCAQLNLDAECIRSRIRAVWKSPGTGQTPPLLRRGRSQLTRSSTRPAEAA